MHGPFVGRFIRPPARGWIYWISILHEKHVPLFICHITYTSFSYHNLSFNSFSKQFSFNLMLKKDIFTLFFLKFSITKEAMV